MRIKSIVALSLAGAAAAAVIAGGAAYANDDTGTDPQVRIVYEEGTGATGGTGAATNREDCPEKSGGQGESAPGGGTGGTTGEQPEADL
ncbi:hypothetical protein WEI85_13170 [Actinomycetes bacterium KLBMP 9797]